MEKQIIKQYGTLTNYICIGNDLRLIDEELKDNNIFIDKKLIEEIYLLNNRDIVKVILYFLN